MEISISLEKANYKNITYRGKGTLMDTIISAAITGGLALLGIIVTNLMNNRKIEQQLEKAQAVTDCKIDELTREVREHNHFAQRMPVVEEQIKHLQSKVEDLAEYHK